MSTKVNEQLESFRVRLFELFSKKLEHLSDIGSIPADSDPVSYIFLDIIVAQTDKLNPRVENLQFSFETYPDSLYGCKALAHGGPSKETAGFFSEENDKKADSLRDFFLDAALDQTLDEISPDILDEVQPLKDRLVLRVQNKPEGTIEARVVKDFYGDATLVNQIAYSTDNHRTVNENQYKEVVTLL